jgi:hypothetical protein
MFIVDNFLRIICKGMVIVNLILVRSFKEIGNRIKDMEKGDWSIVE